jgi:hypothetical protein
MSAMRIAAIFGRGGSTSKSLRGSPFWTARQKAFSAGISMIW